MSNFEVERLRETLLDLERSRQKEESERKIAECLVTGLRLISSTSNRDELFANIISNINSIIPFKYSFLMREVREISAKEIDLQPVYPSNIGNLKLDARLLQYNYQRPFCIFDVKGWEDYLFLSVTNNDCINGSLLILSLITETGKYWFFMLSPDKSGFNRNHISAASRLNELLKQVIVKDEYIAKLIQSNKMRAIGEMAGGIAHEINNPLAIIQGSLDVLNKLIGTDDIPRIKEILKTMEKTVERVSKIIHGLMIVSRGQVATHLFSFVSIEEVLNDTLSCCQEKFKSSGVILTVEIDPEMSQKKYKLNRILLSQVFLNVLNNGYDAIKKNDEKWIKIKVLKSKSEIHFYIIDSGKGISKDLQEKVFQPFYTTKEVGEGTGLGLGICKSIVEDLHGTMFVDGDFKNTCLHVILPLRAEE